MNLIRVMPLFSGTEISPQFVFFGRYCVTLLQLNFYVLIDLLLTPVVIQILSERKFVI